MCVYVDEDRFVVLICDDLQPNMGTAALVRQAQVIPDPGSMRRKSARCIRNLCLVYLRVFGVKGQF